MPAPIRDRDRSRTGIGSVPGNGDDTRGSSSRGRNPPGTAPRLGPRPSKRKEGDQNCPGGPGGRSDCWVLGPGQGPPRESLPLGAGQTFTPSTSLQDPLQSGAPADGEGAQPRPPRGHPRLFPALVRSQPRPGKAPLSVVLVSHQPPQRLPPVKPVQPLTLCSLQGFRSRSFELLTHATFPATPITYPPLQLTVVEGPREPSLGCGSFQTDTRCILSCKTGNSEGRQNLRCRV